MRGLPALLLALGAGCGGSAVEEPRNLLLVTLDSVRPERLEDPGAYCELPLALSHFADEATRFRGCIAVAPGTLPAAASILTGRYPRELGRPVPGRRLPEDAATLAEVLAGEGFETAAFVGSRALAAGSGIERGFALYSDPSSGARREDYGTTDAARDWLRAPERRERPWFVWVHLNAGHGPYRALETAFNPLHFFYKYAVLPPDAARPVPLVRGNSGRGGIPSYQKLTTPAYLGPYTTYYDARVRVGDWFANELRHVLKVTDQYDATVVAMVGTHGESLGEGGVYFDHGEDLSRFVLEVPLLVGVPGRAPSVVEGTVSQVDLFATLLALLGATPADAPPHSRDLFEGGSDVAFSELYPPLGGEEVLAATSDSMKVVRTAPSALVFDLERHPDEATSRRAAASHPLLRALDAFEAEPVAPAPSRPLSPQERTFLRNLGYVIARFE